jgi:uncharacterized protein YbjT (DUF2867 family)
MLSNSQRILVTGGGTFIGDNIAAALLAEGADVTLLVRPGAEDRLGDLRQQLRWWTADVWDTASLRGRARGHSVVINTVGSLVADPTRGLTHQRLNFVSARNIAAMCVSDGVPRMMLLSSAYAPWISRSYLRSKREAERYLGRVGVQGIIIRAPLTYIRRQRRSPFFELMTLLGSVPPLRWTFLGCIAPMPVDILARGVARIALNVEQARYMYYGPDLRRMNNPDELSHNLSDAPAPATDDRQKDDTTPPGSRHPFEFVDEDAPFGWTPPMDRE